MNILITGTAGFIGYHVAKRTMDQGHHVIGIDNLNDYYDVELKKARMRLLEKERFVSNKIDLEDRDALTQVFETHRPECVIHLAAQAGVRYSLENPHAYIQSNIVGTMNVLEACRHYGVKHLLYASSSSVYGSNTKMPFSVHDNVDHPVSLYAATKKANELMAHTYSHLYGIPTTGLRFFTVYGPWGRPDMALFKFTKAILNGDPIDVYNHGEMERDFTYVDDIVEGIVRLVDRIPQPDPDWSGDAPDPGSSKAPYRIYNIGSNRPVKLMTFIRTLEKALEKEAVINYMPMQPGDVPATYADVSDLEREVGYKPATSLEEGIANFVAWYKDYYGVK